MIDALPLLLGPEGYQISRSVRLRSSANAYFNRTPASAGNRKTWTWSGWAKRSNLGAWGALFSSGVLGGTSSFEYITFRSDDTLQWVSYTTSTQASLITTQVFRDPSAWYHIVVAFDSTQATTSNRVKIYVNGVQVTAFSTATYPALNYSSFVNNNQIHTIGRDNSGDYLDGYLTEINFIDGQALTPASFGETNPVTGVWQPKKYAGTYGTNGFYLNFSDNSAATAAAIGKDYSGNGNNWTPNNISVTAGVTYDSMLDVPTQWADGGNGRGNYATWNPLSVVSPTTLSDGNLGVVTGTTGGGGAFSTIAMPTSGKFYFEFVATAVSATLSDNARIGVATASVGNYVIYKSDGNKVVDGTTSAYGSSFALNDVIGCAIDVDSGTVTFYKNNVSQGAITYSTSNGNYFAYTQDGSGTVSVTANITFGQRPFSYTPPSGFKALNTLNLPAPTILKGNQYFDATTYTGNGSTLSVTNSGAMQPDMVWIKSRSNAFNHWLTDSVRGVTKQLGPNQTIAELTASNCVTSFDASGFSIGNDAGHNTNAATYVGWQWKEGATQGFDIVTYTGTGVARTISHSLGVKPAMMIIKNRSGAYDWPTWHQNLPNPTTQHFWLNATNAAQVSGSFNSTQPTSSVFSVGTTSEANANGNNFVAYLFSEVAGFSKFGSYTGNGSTDGPMVFTGHLPRFIIIKRTDTTSAWLMVDTVRQTYNVLGPYLTANTSDAETTGTVVLDVLSNGFKMRSATTLNASGGTYIFASFASNPFKNALAF